MVSSKRKGYFDDLVQTISDNEAGPVEEEVVAPPPKRSKTRHKSKTIKTQGDLVEFANGDDGGNEDDDGTMDSDFEFPVDGKNSSVEEDLDVWDFDGAKKGMSEKKGVDLDAIIQRQMEKKKAGKNNGSVNKEEKLADVEAEAESVEVDLEDDEDGVLADDAFGMGLSSDAAEHDGEQQLADLSKDEGGETSDDGEEDDDAASDSDSVATPVNHPDDEGDTDSDTGSDAEEMVKRSEFFAPEEKAKAGKTVDVSSFQTMSLSRPILRGLAEVGFTKPTPIQAKAIPIALMGRDLVGGAVTGSGKSAAFLLPILERLLYRPKKVPTTRVVILLPTRELAIQCHAVATRLASHTDVKFCLAIGGLSLSVQQAELRLRPDIVIAAPGRFIDHMRNTPGFAVDAVEILVLDEADRMLEDGFADELDEILKTLPKSRQTMLFSATMTSSVDNLIRIGMDKPVRIMVDTRKTTVETLVQEFVRLRPGREEKRVGYLVCLCKNLYTNRAIIFFRQKKMAHRMRIIFGLLGMSCAELHGSLTQSQRIAAVEDFRDGKVPFLLATDVASRGLDIKGIDTVINYEAPQTLDIYVHRVGRTARAGRRGTAVTLAAEPDRKVVKAAVRAGKSQGSKIISRVIEPTEADKWQAKVDDMEKEIEEIMRQEHEEKQLVHVEMQLKKGENMIRHEDEIHSRPKRTWFETQEKKKAAKEAGRAELNGDRERLKKKGAGKLSNKDKKKLDAKTERAEGKSWKKGRAERAGKGAVLNLKSGMKTGKQGAAVGAVGKRKPRRTKR